MKAVRTNSRIFSGLEARTQTIRELVELLVASGRWWLVPMVAVLLATSVLLLVLQAAEYVAPFVYSIF